MHRYSDDVHRYHAVQCTRDFRRIFTAYDTTTTTAAAAAAVIYWL